MSRPCGIVKFCGHGAVPGASLPNSARKQSSISFWSLGLGMQPAPGPKSLSCDLPYNVVSLLIVRRKRTKVNQSDNALREITCATVPRGPNQLASCDVLDDSHSYAKRARSLCQKLSICDVF